jgi:hypothetical protein
MYGVTSKGQIKTWACDVLDNGDGTATLAISTQTKLDGKTVEREEIITEGKNLGKKNETTPYEQAVSEAESRYRKKFKKGYGTEIPTDLTKADCNLLGLPHPMRAYPLKDVKKVEFKEGETYAQPKFDGHRAIVTRQDGRLLMYSRGGDEITTMGHILEYLEDRVAEGEFLDGELYLHGELLQDIGSFIKKYRPGISEKIVLYVYDTILDVSYTQRYKILRIKLADSDGPVYLSPTRTVGSMEEALAFRDEMIADGYEGAMLRCPDNGYEPKKKSRTLIKLKTFDDSEHTIVDVVEGKDRIVNDVCLKVACFKCETPEGMIFEVTAMGDMYEKDRTWHNREEFIGKMLTVKHSGYTKSKKPWHPVAFRLREDI